MHLTVSCNYELIMHYIYNKRFDFDWLGTLLNLAGTSLVASPFDPGEGILNKVLYGKVLLDIQPLIP